LARTYVHPPVFWSRYLHWLDISAFSGIFITISGSLAERQSDFMFMLNPIMGAGGDAAGRCFRAYCLAA
jgi:hypothetical protein